MSTRTLFGKAFTEKGKKGQLQIGVTMIVVFLFIVLLMFSLIFYFRFVYSETRETAETLADQRNSGLLSTVLGLPEFRCSRLGIEEECLDASKLYNLGEITDNNPEYYGGLFEGVKGIWVEVLDPDGSGYFGPKFEIYGESSGVGKIYAVPVSIYYPDYQKYKIGLLRIRGESI